MADFEIVLTPQAVGSMNDRVDPTAVQQDIATELRDLDLSRTIWDGRLGWARINNDALPCETIIGGDSFRDSTGRLHTVVVGSDGNLYHGVGEHPTGWNLVTVYADVAPLWDVTYRAKLAQWREQVFITLWQPREVLDIPPAGTQNLRLRLLTGIGGDHVAYGVSLAKPATGITAADGGLGDILPTVREYKVTFLDNTTGWMSDESPTVDITLEDPLPSQTMMVAAVVNAGAGAITAAFREYFSTFYDPATGRESDPSPVLSQTIPAADSPADVDLYGIETCKEVGPAWQRRIWARDNGGGIGYDSFHLLTTIADNTTVVYADTNAAVSGAAYARTGRTINLTNIPVYAGGGTPANGRDIYRQIWASDNGQPFALLATLTDNTTVTHADTTNEIVDEPYAQRKALPACAFVERLGSKIIWAFDRENVLPARIIVPLNDDEPEAYGVERLAGEHSDPITGLLAGRAVTLVSKLRGWHRMDPTCETCDEIMTGFGAVADQGNHYLDSRIPFLSPEGPRLLRLYGESDAPFLGADAERFCLSELWRQVVKSRLPYCASLHWRSAGVVLWGVTICDWPDAPIKTNDTVIVWDYASISKTNPGGTVYIITLVGWDCGWMRPGNTSADDEPWGGFATGWVGRLFSGKHGDGTVGNLVGTILGVSGSVVDVDDADLGVQNVVGSILYINGGTGTRICRPVSACENQRALIIGQCGGRLILAGELAIDTTSQYWVGGFPRVIEVMLNPARQKPMQRQWDSVDVYTVPDS